MATTELNNFNQTMVGNTQNTGVANTSTPGVFTGAKSVNFLGTPAQATNPAPTIVSNYNTAGKVNEVTDKFNNLSTPYQQAPQNQGMFGVDQETINNFKQANPNLDFTREDAEYAKQADMQKSYYTPEAEYAMKGFDSLKTESDDITKQYLQQTQDKYKQLQEDQKIANSQAQNAALMALGTQGGSGSPTDRNSYVQAVIDQGQRKLQALNLEERGVYLEALKAQKDENYKLFADKVKQLDVVRNAKIAEAQTFNQKLQEQAEKVKEDAIQAQKQNSIADLVSKGVTDPAQLLKTLKAQGVNATLKEVTDTTALLSGIGGTGIIGEYNYYKSEAQRQGQVPVDFQTYQDMDANRKKLATTPSGLTTSQNASFLRITDKFQADPIINNAIKGQTAIAIADQVLANPAAAPNQLKALYSLVKNLDPDSAVREGEISLAQQTQSYYSTWKTALDRVSTGAVIAPETAAALANATKELATAWESTAKKRQKQYEAQASGAGIKDAFSEYLQTSDLPYSTGNKIIETEQQAQKAFESLKNNPPEIQAEITARYNDLQEVLGHPPTATEYFKYNPWDMPQTQAFNTVVGDTNLSQDVVGGINLKGYAVDPNQIKAVATLYNKVPDTSNALDYDTFIKSVAPKSQIKGQDIIAAADVYNLDPKIILALMQHESRLGTSTVALANNNFGGITWSPTYAKNNPGVTKGTPRPANEGGYYVKFATPLEGLMAQAKLLSNRKIA